MKERNVDVELRDALINTFLGLADQQQSLDSEMARCLEENFWDLCEVDACNDNPLEDS